jgi:hypothetical protein
VAAAVLPKREGYSLTRQYEGPTYEVKVMVLSGDGGGGMFPLGGGYKVGDEDDGSLVGQVRTLVRGGGGDPRWIVGLWLKARLQGRATGGLQGRATFLPV